MPLPPHTHRRKECKKLGREKERRKGREGREKRKKKSRKGKRKSRKKNPVPNMVPPPGEQILQLYFLGLPIHPSPPTPGTHHTRHCSHADSV